MTPLPYLVDYCTTLDVSFHMMVLPGEGRQTFSLHEVPVTSIESEKGIRSRYSMCAQEKSTNKGLSQIVANLFVRSKGGEDLSSRIQRLRDEIRKGAESEEDIYGRFRGLLESFREIIPEEKQRYHAAIKALSTTSKLSRQEIIKAVNDQIEEIKVLEKGMLPVLPSWRDDQKAVKTKAKQMSDEIAKLREKIARLESEERVLLEGIAAREKEIGLVETAIRGAFADIREEIIRTKNKIVEFTAEPEPAQPVPQKDAVTSVVPGGPRSGVELKNSEIHGPSEQQETKWQKKCPMCGGHMNLEAGERMWLCYSCAYEESNTDAAQDMGDGTSTPTSAPASEPEFDPLQPHAASLASLTSDEYQGSTQDPAEDQPTKTKPCPVCRKKMFFYPKEKAWRCPSCEYERRI